MDQVPCYVIDLPCTILSSSLLNFHYLLVAATYTANNVNLFYINSYGRNYVKNTDSLTLSSKTMKFEHYHHELHETRNALSEFRDGQNIENVMKCRDGQIIENKYHSYCYSQGQWKDSSDIQYEYIKLKSKDAPPEVKNIVEHNSVIQNKLNMVPYKKNLTRDSSYASAEFIDQPLPIATKEENSIAQYNATACSSLVVIRHLYEGTCSKLMMQLNILEMLNSTIQYIPQVDSSQEIVTVHEEDQEQTELLFMKQLYWGLSDFQIRRCLGIVAFIFIFGFFVQLACPTVGPFCENSLIEKVYQGTSELWYLCNIRLGLERNDCGEESAGLCCKCCDKQQGDGLRLREATKFLRDDETGIEERTFEEQMTNIKLEQPPAAFNPRDLRQRLQSFQSQRNILCSAEDLATAGFYLTHDNLATCYSCHIRHRVEDFRTEQSPFSHQLHQFSCQHLRSHTQQQLVGRTESDGRVSDDIADPPGQQSIYIPPGDCRREAYRLSTFEHFPVTCPISRKSLAKSGFTFTGFYDRVKCFACGRTVERWEERDNPAELRWHKPTCPFPKGGECANVPLPSLFGALASAPLSTPGGQSSSATPRQQNPASQPAYPGEQVVEQLDPNTGQIIRRVRYPPDLPERIRQSGGTFEIGPNNQVIIRSGPGPAPRNPANVGIGAQNQPRRQWRMANVISADHKRFVTNLFLYRELDRLASFARWPVARPNIAPAYLAKSGFFYLGDMDRTQCFSCGGVLRNWSLDDDATAEHRTHFPQCRMVLGNEPRNIPLHEHPETEEEKEERYPCRFPSNPHMRSEQARLGTFDRRWPMGRTAATPAEIAQGGFFFLGERDRAKCWYCNGGLQNWEYDDIPWIEHAKWFPNCQFLLRVKGQHFVYRHLALNPHLARPIIARQDGSPLEAVGQPAQGAGAQAPRAQDIPPSEPRVRQPTPPPTIIDPQEEMRKRKERIENIMNNSEVVKVVLSMGFEKKIVAALLEDRINSGNVANPNDIYESVGLLLDDVMKKEEELKKEEEERRNRAAAAATPNPSLSGPNSFRTMSSLYSGVSSTSGMSSLGPSPGSGKYNVSYYDDEGEDERMNRDMYGSMEGTSASITSVTTAKRLHAAEENPESLREALNKIEEERMCKICFTNAADMVFVPCSHMCCCMECTQAIRQCPVCRKKIDKAIKTYVN